MTASVFSHDPMLPGLMRSLAAPRALFSSPLSRGRCLANSYMLSSDVSAGYDPSFTGSFEIKNAAIMGHGLAFNKFTGSGGKVGSNDADAEYVALIRRIMDNAGVQFQTAELVEC